MRELLNYINGALVPAREGRWLDNVNPALGVVYSRVCASSAADIELAVSAARAAYPMWSSLSATERSIWLKRIASGIRERFDELAESESVDNGKPVSLARRVDIPRGSANLDFFAEAILEFEGESFQGRGAGDNQTHYQPLGVVGVISPWNLPLYLLTWKIAPALAAGNTVIAKPSEITPLTASILGEICRDIGLPPGVLNIVHGTGPEVGGPLTAHPDVKAISFTGSTATGKRIARVAAESLKKCSLEMGGKNPNLIFADCDFERALSATVRSTFANQGQICLCGSRIYVERPLYERFRDALVERTRELVVGDPLDPATEQGAVVSRPHFEKVLSYIKLAREEGGEILCGGEALDASGYFIKPTLIEGLGPDCRVNQEEIFGPVATIMPFDDEPEVIAWANNTEYGLAATIWSEDEARAQRVASQIDAGVVWINTWLTRDLRTPFGGMKSSGRGREGGRFALEFFSEVKNICIQRDLS